MAEGTLYSYRMTDVTLTDAIQKCRDFLEDAIALFYSPEFCEFAKLDELGNLEYSQDKDGKEKDINLKYQEKHIFEARLFNDKHELRWLNQTNGKGYAVLISEEKSSNLSEAKEKPFIDKIDDRQYLIWGEKAKTQPSERWIRLSTARIGSIDVPLDKSITKEQQVYLKTVEYLAEIDEFRNVSVIEERLVKLEVK